LSIPANIAEGFGRRQPRDKAKFYIIAKASAEELSDYLMFAQSRGYWPDIARVFGKLEEVGRMLRSLIRKTYDMDSQ
jgi:four helix bundle protein